MKTFYNRDEFLDFIMNFEGELTTKKVKVYFEGEIVAEYIRQKLSEPDEMLKTIALIVECSTDEIKSKSRKTDLVYCRIIFAKLMHGKLSLAEIGKMINRDHSSIVYYIKTFKNEIKHNKKFKRYFDEVLRNL